MKVDQTERDRRARARLILIGYPVVILLVSVVVDVFVLGVEPLVFAAPSAWSLRALIAASVLLVFNHTWIMTATELVRGRYRLQATPEEWTEAGLRAEDAPAEGVRELQRCHNLHRNSTENTVVFALLVLPFVMVSPSPTIAGVWIVGFAVARLDYTFAYLAKRTGVRGAFMTLSLLAMYGVATYLVAGLFL